MDRREFLSVAGATLAASSVSLALPVVNPEPHYVTLMELLGDYCFSVKFKDIRQANLGAIYAAAEGFAKKRGFVDWVIEDLGHLWTFGRGVPHLFEDDSDWVLVHKGHYKGGKATLKLVDGATRYSFDPQKHTKASFLKKIKDTTNGQT